MNVSQLMVDAQPTVVIAETTALGAAYAAGLAVGFWPSTGEIRANWAADRRWSPSMDATQRASLYSNWKKAVTKTFDWTGKRPDGAAIEAQGIYELDGNKFRLCYTIVGPDTKRPAL